MKAIVTCTMLVAVPLWALAQTQHQPLSSYQPAVPQAPSMTTSYGGYGGYYGGSGGGTVAGSYMNGMSNVISAQGNYNLATSAAAVNMTQARSNEIKNQQDATNAYFAMRATNQAATARENGPPLTGEQMTWIAQQGVPKPLTKSEMNPVSGGLQWPAFLAQPSFAPRTQEIDKLMAKQAHYGSLDYAEQMRMKELIASLHADMKAQINNMPTSDYTTSRAFLNSLSYATTKSTI